MIGARPPSADELARAKNKKTLTLPGSWETARQVKSSMTELVRFDLPDDFWIRYPDQVRQLDLAQVSAAADEVLHPKRVIWIVVGDREKIEPGIRELGFGELVTLDADGNPTE
jgi:zinc protease